MSGETEKIRYILQYYFEKGYNAAKAHKKICAHYGEGTLCESVVRKWFARFRSGNFDVKDAPRSGRPCTEKVDEILAKVKEDRHISTRSIAEDLGIDQKTVCSHLNKAGYTKKLDIWIPHNLTEKNLIDRISICESLLKRNYLHPFLKCLITGDEKWITYDNDVRKRSWSKRDERAQTVAKPSLTPRKVMLCIWWDWKGVVYYELLPTGQTINSELYCQQLERLSAALKEKRPELVNRKSVAFHHDNARPHASLTTREKLRDLGWEVLMHPPYSPDIAPSDYHLFRSLQNYLNGVKLNSVDDCKTVLATFFDQKPQKFFEDGIMALPKKWQEVVNNNGKYLT